MRRRQPFSRTERFGKQVQRSLAEIFLRGTILDESLGYVGISSVEVSRDLRIAKVRVLAGNPSTPVDEVLAALEEKRGRLRKELSRSLNARVTPELRFEADRSLDSMERLGAIFAGLSPETEEGAGIEPDGELSET